MATAPQINFLDGSGTTTRLTLTTNLLGLAFSGVIDSNTIDVQININGSGFVSDPTLVGLTLPTFRVPNPISYPSGLRLDKGQNTIQLRSIDLFGAVSPISIIIITVVADTDLQSFQVPPTGLRLQRSASSVSIQWSNPAFIQNGLLNPYVPNPITGYNVYASVGPGGTTSGYLRLNKDLIPANSSTQTVFEEFPLLDVQFDLADPSGNDFVIQSYTKDPVTGVTIDQKSFNTTSLVSSQGFRLHSTVTNLVANKFYSFIHNRGDGVVSGVLNNDTFGAIPDTDPVFYVVTAVYSNNSTGQVIESRFSPELAGNPLPLDTTVRGINIRTRRTVTQDYINEIQQVQPQLSLIPGSTVREVHIEPFSNEIQKAYFLLDFVARSKSFAALLQIDDPGLTGTSIPVANSQYKQNLASALGITSENAVQSLINGSFDSLAQNFSQNRQGRRAATVLQTFYVTSKPTRDLIVAQNAIVSSSTNSAAPRFKSNGQVTMTAIDAQKFYNQDTKRYEIKVQLSAETPGTAGNIPAGALDQVVSGASGFKTVNDTSADFGSDNQSNLQLAEACMRSLSSLDSGTDGGYFQTVIGTPGVFDLQVVKSGDQFMMRDFDPVRMKHIGGKVDIYVKGINERTVTEPFAFQFSQALNTRFDVIDQTNLVFRARDSRLTQSNPISQILFNTSQGLGLRNHSNLPTTPYDLTGAILIDYQTIKLNTSIPQPTTHLDDFIEGDYRFRSNNKFIASVQPVRRVSSIVGELSGALDPALGFTLFKLEDPLLNGYSTAAQDYVVINQIGNIPSGQAIQVNAESHVLIGQFKETLNSVGVNTFTISVYSRDRTILYNGPTTTNPDYLIIPGNQTTHAKIIRTVLSRIPTGATVSVDYAHDENFKLTYVVNDTLQTVQARINKTKHTTADVLVKEAVQNPMSTSLTIQLKKNAVQSSVDDKTRTAITILTDSKGTGGPVHQSDMSTKIGEVDGIDYMVQPFTKMTLQDGALRIRDQIQSSYVFLAPLSKFANGVYLLTQSLPFNTIDSGGLQNIHHGVFMDDQIMSMASSLNQVGDFVNQSWIIGSQGAIIKGYSDDATLLPIYFTPAAVIAARIALTANRMVVSLNSGTNPIDVPSNHQFSASYVVMGDVGSKDINVSAVEYLTPGEITLTFRPAS